MKKSLEDLLQDCESSLLEVLESGSDWVWETNRDHRFTFLSTQLKRTTSLKLENLIGARRIDGLIRDSVLPEVLQRHLDDLANHRPFKDFEYSTQAGCAECAPVWCSVSGFPVFAEDGSFTGYRGNGRNITDRMEAQLAQESAEQELLEINATLERRIATRTVELETSNARLLEREQALEVASKHAAEVNRIRSELFADFSHDLRTPLNGIIGTNLLLQQTDLSDRQTELTSLIDRSAKSLLDLVNDLMDLARIEAGVIELHHEVIDPFRVVQDAVDMLIPVASEKGIPVKLVTHPDLPQQIEIDPVRFRQILLNLLGNAIKFTGPEGHIHITAGPCEQGGFRCEVADTGVGIPAHEQDRVFERFHIAHDSGNASGTGLGLAICRHLTECMQGKIGVKSEPGHGSTFWLELPPRPKSCAL
ncbi:MAG: PAS domain-containing sensor histidine kinase [Pseudomonadota bacterium]